MPSQTHIEVLPREPFSPKHHVTLRMGGENVHCVCLKSISTDRPPQRDTILIRRPEKYIHLLAKEDKQRWEQYSDWLQSLQSAWLLGNTATLKRVVRLSSENPRFSTAFVLPTVAYHYGAIPALEISSVGSDCRIAILNRKLTDLPNIDRAEDHLEKIRSYREYLPVLLQCYCEQISFYFQSIFFAAEENRVIRYANRIRTILSASICGKIDEILSESAFPVAKQLKREMRRDYAKHIREAQALYCFGHLLVNYIYSFFCISNRAPEYDARLQKISSEDEIFESHESIHLMKHCAEHIRNPDGDPRFLSDVDARFSVTEWMRPLVDASAFVAEIRRSCGNDFSRSRIFVGYHFTIPSSDSAFGRLNDLVLSRCRNCLLIRGRYLGQNIQWSLLARIWIADFQILFIPSSLIQGNGETKELRLAEDWVIMELLYGQMIRKSLQVVCVENFQREVFEKIREQIRQYSDNCEFDQVAHADWATFVKSAKESLHKILRTERFLEFSPGATATEEENFLSQFKTRVLDPAHCRLIELFFEALYWYFPPDTYSVLQIILKLLPSGQGISSINSIVECLVQNRVSWAVPLSQAGVDKRVRLYLRELSLFSFEFFGRKLPLVKRHKSGRAFTAVSLHISSIFDLLQKEYKLTEDHELRTKILTRLIRPRLD